MTVKLLGIDPGLASLGWAVIELTRNTDRLIDLGVIITEKSHKKLEVLVSADNLRRGREQFSALKGVLTKHHKIGLIATESLSWPRNAAAIGKVGISWGVLCSHAEQWRIPMVQISPQALKKAICGIGNAPKDEVMEEISKREGYETFKAQIMAIPRKANREHPSDATAAAVACLESGSEVVRMFRQGST